MKVCLIFPRYKYPSGDTPLGIAYIASYIRENSGCEIEIIDTTFHRDKEEIKNILKKKRYDLVGISVMTSMIKDAYSISEYIKKKSPKTKIVFGGPHATVMAEKTLENKNIDAICVGEGENTCLDLIKNNLEFKYVKGLYYKKGKKIIKNPPQDPIHDLDSLPFPSLDLLPIDEYIAHWFPLDSVKSDLRGINIITSRGCPFKCTYCQPTLFRIFGTRIRKRSPKNIIKELEFLKKKYNINAFMFQDDTFVFDKKWVDDICSLLIKKKLNLVWGANTRANLVNEKLFRKMKKAGLRKAFMGIESGSQRVLDEIYDKKIKVEDVIRSVKILKKIGIRIQGYFMIGAPTETEEEIDKTIKFARSLDIDEATFSITTPLPQTYLYDKTKSMIKKDVSDFDYYKKPVYEMEIGEMRLNYLKKKALLHFYLSPKHIKSTIKGFITPTALKKSIAKLKRF